MVAQASKINFRSFEPRSRNEFTTTSPMIDPAGNVGHEVEECWVTVDNCRLRYLRYPSASVGYESAAAGTGPEPLCPSQCSGNAPAVLLIHGLLGYSFSWRHNLRSLAACGSAYAFDLPGLGYSDRPTGTDRSLPGVAATILRALDALQVAKVYAVGTSYGGVLALALAGLAPERVVRLVLVAPVNPWSEPGRRRTRWLATAPGRAVLRCFFPCLSPLSGYLLGRMYGDPERIAPGTAEAYAAPLQLPGTVEYLLGVIRTWHTDQRRLEQVLPRIAQIPLLLVWGDRDPVVPLQSAEPLQRQFAAARLVVLPGVGHLPYEEAPEEFNRTVCEFLAQ